MITAVDSSVLFDILLDDSTFADPSEQALQKSSREGALIVCEAVYAEVAGFFPERATLNAFFQEAGIRLSPSTPETLFKAGHLWKQTGLRRSHATSPTTRRLLADFLIGAHALMQAEQLLTRDKDFFHSTFTGLRLA